ncbi:type I-E CRISPR-associated protein Cas7/Cse4/CasC [Paratractidigestivibacter sp.]|uniref:type I-E CRISPR-associated protein Cas7/Cse4/CasC n=1 Tax=Paratractidigestivibacter sp. TaxID=2847316 RepID=UPI002ACB15D1|nr:type I-E CRISPR-associated protein Cas7/Cse4/CasC [Paratractidigestivibacter sp.]
MFVDIYAIQTVPPSNINRDDTGSPKTAIYGGVRRARVSSQAWKRAMRESFSEYLPEGSLGVRTKLAAELLADSISKKRSDLADRAPELAAAVLRVLGLEVEKSRRSGDDEGKQSTSYLVFIARHELAELADIAIGWADDGKDLKKLSKKSKPEAKEAKRAFSGSQAVDVALFGRMLADVPELNTDASSQVAHAISVDKVTQEFDYFTAIDDCASDDNAGAAMINTVDFNSSTLYRYATVNVDALFDQLEDADATSRGVAAFAEAFVRSMPTGKQNTFANRTLPNYVLVALRDKQPINAVSAFEEPVQADDGTSVSRRAAKRLGDRIKGLEDAYDMKSLDSWYVSEGGDVDELGVIASRVTLAELIKNVQSAVVASCSSGE